MTFHTIKSLCPYILKHFTRILIERARKKHDNFRPGYKLPYQDGGCVFWNVCKFYQTIWRHITEDSNRCHKKTEMPHRHIRYLLNIEERHQFNRKVLSQSINMKSSLSSMAAWPVVRLKEVIWAVWGTRKQRITRGAHQFAQCTKLNVSKFEQTNNQSAHQFQQCNNRVFASLNNVTAEVFTRLNRVTNRRTH